MVTAALIILGIIAVFIIWGLWKVIDKHKKEEAAKEQAELQYIREQERLSRVNARELRRMQDERIRKRNEMEAIYKKAPIPNLRDYQSSFNKGLTQDQVEEVERQAFLDANRKMEEERRKKDSSQDSVPYIPPSDAPIPFPYIPLEDLSPIEERPHHRDDPGGGHFSGGGSTDDWTPTESHSHHDHSGSDNSSSSYDSGSSDSGSSYDSGSSDSSSSFSSSD